MLKKLTGAAVLAGACAFLLYAPSEDSTPSLAEEISPLIPAEVHLLRPGPKQDLITSHGQISPRWQSTLSAEVSGRVVSISPALLTGSQFKRGDILAEIEDTTYRSAVASAHSSLASAQRALLEEEQRGKLALDNWRASGLGGEPSPLTLRQPQLAEVQAALEAAEAALAQAEYDLHQTRISAPFDGVVVSRSLNPGEVIQSGSQIAVVFDASVFEVTTPLTADQMKRLDLDPKGEGTRARLSTPQGNNWWGRIVRVDPAVDAQNRWVNVVVEMDSHAGAMPGQFVTVDLQGRHHAALYDIPEALISRQGQLWFLDETDHLKSVSVEPIFVADGRYFITPPAGHETELRVALPRSSYLKGSKVRPRVIAASLPLEELRANLKIGNTNQ
ncbi:efflux RND transporter periplasmic adaptor subunit [Phaeobacter sp. 11ANDIMAR09]|uniref:efflux RND transporter periplasmic adaptor subunit n=1 Tax=Phaeobacter sp. 11ANDIMAR09 TaxID=1225647 RepID=UPI000A498589|nr:efflux RND transporter periplasmic adaptor subunit [Phaeobacter sp. 11ANDIMAR09]